MNIGLPIEEAEQFLAHANETWQYFKFQNRSDMVRTLINKLYLQMKEEQAENAVLERIALRMTEEVFIK